MAINIKIYGMDNNCFGNGRPFGEIISAMGSIFFNPGALHDILSGMAGYPGASIL
jgi:hypothetical protein